VHDIDAWWDMKRGGYVRPTSGFIAIHMPRGTSAGIILAGISAVLGFALIWHIWWLAVSGFAGLVGFAIFHTFNLNRDFHIPADEVTRVEDARTRALAATGA